MRDTADRFAWHPEPELIDVRDPDVSRAALERLPDAIFEGDDPRRSVERSRQTDVRRDHAVNEESRIFRPHGPQRLNEKRRAGDERDRDRHLGGDKDAEDTASRPSGDTSRRRA